MIVRETMARNDHVHNSRIAVNEYADCFGPSKFAFRQRMGDFVGQVLIGHIPDALDCRYLMKNKQHKKLNCCQCEPIVRTSPYFQFIGQLNLIFFGANWLCAINGFKNNSAGNNDT